MIGRSHSLNVATLAVAAAMALAACGPGEDRTIVRGRGLRSAEVGEADRAQVYNAAVRAAFDFGPALSLLVHPRELPRHAGRASRDSLPGTLIRRLRSLGAVQGTCDSPDVVGAKTPTCRAALPGYVVRFSDVLTVSRDTVQVYVDAERYDTPETGSHQAMRFERAYQLTRRGGWRVVRQARVQ